MDPLLYDLENAKVRRQTPNDRENHDLFGEPPTPSHPKTPPHQPKSDTSREAAVRIAPTFEGNKRTCYNAILAAESRGGTTRKEIADAYFEGKQNFVTGPVAQLIESKSVFEKPERNERGEIKRRSNGSSIPVRRDGSAVLLPVREKPDAEA